MSFDDSDDGISNCLLYANTKTGMVFIDPYCDNDSIIDELFDEFKLIHPDVSGIKEMYDCHLDDHLYLGRDMDNDAMQIFLYEEGFLTDNMLFKHFDNVLNELELDNSRPIVLTGTFSLKRDELKDLLEDNGFTVSEKVTASSWLWVGDKPGASKLKAAKKHNVEITQPIDLMKLYVEKVENDNRPR